MTLSHRTQLIRIFGLLILFLLIGSTGYHYIEGYNWVNSFYMTAVIMSTVGFGGGLGDLSELGRLFTVGLIVFGVTVGAYALTYTAEFIFQNPIIRKRKMAKRISGLNNHYIVCGYGRMGKIICNELSKREQNFVVIDHKSEKIEAASEAGYIGMEGDCLIDSTLKKANIQFAKGLVAVLKKEENNLFVTLSARGANPELYIISKNSYEINRKKFLTAGANKVLNPYEIAGHSLANMLIRPAVVDFLEVISQGSEVDWETDEIIVEDKSKIMGQEIRQAFDREELDFIIAAIQKPDGKMMFNPRGRTVIETGDKLIAMGYYDNLKILEDYCRKLQTAG